MFSSKTVLPCKRSIAQILSIKSTACRGFSQLGFPRKKNLCFFAIVLQNRREILCLVAMISFRFVHHSSCRISRKIYMVESLPAVIVLL